jgi:hypothetical protein
MECRMSSGQHRHHQNELGSTSELVGSNFDNGSTGGKPSRSTYCMEFGEYIRSGRITDRRYFGDVTGHTRNPRGVLCLVWQMNAPGMSSVTDSRDQRRQLRP